MAIFELRDVHPVGDGRRACRTEPPEQSLDVVIAGRRSHRQEFEFGGKGGLKRCNGVADSLAPFEPLFSFEEDSILGIEVGAKQLDVSGLSLSV